MKLDPLVASLALLAVVGCTYDYDAFLGGEGGGASSATTSASQSSGTGGATSGSSSTSSSSSTGSSSNSAGGEDPSSSSASGTGGNGQGGSGGQGGAPPELPGDTPCPALGLPANPDGPDDFGVWTEERSGSPGSSEARNVAGELEVEIDSDGPVEYAEIQSPADALDGCSIAIPLQDVDSDQLNEVADRMVAYVSARPDGGAYQGFELRYREGGMCRLHVTATFGGDDVIPSAACPAPGDAMRVRHTGEGEVCFDLLPSGGAWKELHCLATGGPVGATIGVEATEDGQVWFGSLEGG